MKIYVNASELKALQILAAVKDLRYYLNGVKVEATSKEVRMIATDGHRMGILRTACRLESEVEGLAEIIIPNDAIKALKVPARASHDDIEIAEANDGWWTLTPMSGGNPVMFKPIDGTYPDYRRAIPAKVSKERAEFNAEYVFDFLRVARLLNSRDQTTVLIGHNGDGAALVSIHNEQFVGVLIPVRGSAEPPTETPEWVLGALDGTPEPEQPKEEKQEQQEEEAVVA